MTRKKYACITGASSGIGRDMAFSLGRRGYDVILAARDIDRLNKVKDEIGKSAHVIAVDLTKISECERLYKEAYDIGGDNIEVFINNAGFGLFGEFLDSSLDTELSMIDTNVTALHVLTKLFLKKFCERDRGYILNVASSAAFMPGPLMATYYATKAYVLRLSEAIDRELKNKKRNVYIGALCPGPVDTNFNNTANVRFAIKGLSSEYVAEYAVKKMFKNKTVIVPGVAMKMGKFGLRFLPDFLITKIAYNIQRKKA